MHFHGTNKLTLSRDTLRALLEERLQHDFGNSNVRIKDVEIQKYGGDMEIEFTTDPLPTPEPFPAYVSPVPDNDSNSLD